MQRALPVAAGIAVLLAFCAAPAGAATHKTWHLWSKETSSAAFDAAGNPVTDPNAAPTVGFVFVGGDDDYLGNHIKHGKKVVATDHISCTVTQVDLSIPQLVTLCYGQIALPGGMVFADHQTIDFAKNPTTFTITGGAGKYRGAKGTLVADAYGDSSNNNTDLTLSITY